MSKTCLEQQVAEQNLAKIHALLRHDVLLPAASWMLSPLGSEETFPLGRVRAQQDLLFLGAVCRWWLVPGPALVQLPASLHGVCDSIEVKDGTPLASTAGQHRGNRTNPNRTR